MNVNVHISNDALEELKKHSKIDDFWLLKTVFGTWQLVYGSLTLASSENAEQILIWCDLNGFDSSKIKLDHSLFDWYMERLHS